MRKTKGAGRAQRKSCGFMCCSITLSLDPLKNTRLEMRSQTTNVTNYVLRNQLGVRSSCDKRSKHNFASSLKMTALHLSWIASCIAHRIALAFACDGEQRWCSLPQREKATPKWFLATVAKADLVLLRVALTLILIQPWEGGWWGGGGSPDIWGWFQWGTNAWRVHLWGF